MQGKISSSNFRSFGKLIDYPHKDKKGTKRNLWRIIHHSPNNNGWRVAYLVLRDKSIGRMECHPFSDETFEPVSGRSILFISKQKSFADIQCFLLDRPIIINKGIWHAVITLDNESELKITENHKISSKYWEFGFRVKSLDDLIKKSKSSRADDCV